ncbi:MAG: beta-N-acetylhexosaminidase [Lentisphaerae bacterium]|nr:beta-N-acetylhexosaminidase [Lentisphaerota bacterium]
MKLIWQRNNTPEELFPLLETLSSEYPISESGNGTILSFKKVESDTLYVNVASKDGKALISYSSVAAAARGIGMVLSGLQGENKATFETVGIMVDVSRNMVMTVEHFKKWLRRLALSGGNIVFIYAEDTYKMEDEPFFGFGRGGYTMAELQELDRYAISLGIELVGCIQTLAHMAQVLQWPAYNKVKDTENCLLVGADATYKLIEKMFDFWSQALSSRRIHIGMDEAHDLGRGKYLTLNGRKPTWEIMTAHLKKVEVLAAERGLKPMIWSDMFFTHAGGGYYNPNAEFPIDTADEIPESVSLVYWDYYNRDAEFYAKMIRCHRKLGRNILMGSGLWTWYRWWYDPWQSERTIRPCIAACQQEKVREIFFTMWKDNGAYCCYDSGLAGIVLACDLCYGVDDKKLTSKRFAAVCHADYDAVILAGRMTIPMGYELVQEASPVINPVTLLWDDPLSGIGYGTCIQMVPDFVSRTLRQYDELLEKLPEFCDSNEAGSFSFAISLINAVRQKLAIREALLAAYAVKDRTKLHNIAYAAIPAAVAALHTFEAEFRKQWLAAARPQGMECIQIRNAGVAVRLEETALRIKEFLDGTIDSIAELEEPLPDINGFLSVGRYDRVAMATANH